MGQPEQKNMNVVDQLDSNEKNQILEFTVTLFYESWVVWNRNASLKTWRLIKGSTLRCVYVLVMKHWIIVRKLMLIRKRNKLRLSTPPSKLLLRTDKLNVMLKRIVITEWTKRSCWSMTTRIQIQQIKFNLNTNMCCIHLKENAFKPSSKIKLL